MEGIVKGIHLDIALVLDVFHLFIGPCVQGDGLDLADVGAQLSMIATALDAQEDTQVPAGPPRPFTTTISTVFVSFFLTELLQNLFVLLCGCSVHH